MSGVDVAIYAVIGLIGSFCSGLLGVGGAIVTYPLLYFVPPLFAAYAMTPNEISSTTMLQVLVSSGIGMLMYRKSPWRNKRVIVVIGGGMLLGSLTGGLFTGIVSGTVIHLLYGFMALTATVLIVQKQTGSPCEDIPAERIDFPELLGFIISFLVGCLSGIVGAGGSFLLIPLMIRLLKLPTRTAVCCSLTIVFISSIGGAVGKIAAGHIDYEITGLLVGVSLFGSMLGAQVGQRINAHLLRLIFAIILFITASNIWGEMIWKTWVAS